MQAGCQSFSGTGKVLQSLHRQNLLQFKLPMSSNWGAPLAFVKKWRGGKVIEGEYDQSTTYACMEIPQRNSFAPLIYAFQKVNREAIRKYS
jgi:hypothetical protein